MCIILIDLYAFGDIIPMDMMSDTEVCIKMCLECMNLNILTYFNIVGCLISFAWISPCLAQESNDIDHSSTESIDSTENIPVQAKILIRAYPDQHLKYLDNQIIFEDGTAIKYDDGTEKDFSTMLDNSDVEDMFSIKYTREGTPGYLQDPGRSRCEPLFKKMYGKDAKSVKKNLVKVAWFGTTIKFSQINGAAEQLRKVADEIRGNHPELIPYMKSSGTFYWRKVRHTSRQSAHSYGIAIDIAVKQSDYWKWAHPKASETDEIDYHNRIPLTLVDIFEKHGFIWGGRWYHYDTMHFEYRPEIIQNHPSECDDTDPSATAFTFSGARPQFVL